MDRGGRAPSLTEGYDLDRSSRGGDVKVLEVRRRARRLIALARTRSAQQYEHSTPCQKFWRRAALVVIFRATLTDVANLWVLFVGLYWKVFFKRGRGAPSPPPLRQSMRV